MIESRHIYIDSCQLDDNNNFSVEIDSLASELIFECRCAVLDNKNGREKSWHVSWLDRAGQQCDVAVSWGNTAFGTDYDTRYLSVTASISDSIVAHSRISDRVDLTGGYNSLELRLCESNSAISIGNKVMSHICDLPEVSLPQKQIAIGSKDKLDISEVRIESVYDRRPSLCTDWTLDSLKSHIALSDDKAEGFWTYLDRENDPDLATLGGRYTLATVKSGDGYDIIYVDGSKINPDLWECGKIKGHLSPTIFKNHYNLVWYDAEMSKLDADDETFASLDDNMVLLTLNFPLLSSKMRFSKARLEAVGQ